ncbi:URH1 [Sanghuangporus weigelae]
MAGKRVWLDCDPGHDDATAILLAIHIPGITLVGISTVHGNTDADNTFKNALRCLYAFGADPSILVHRGASSPLLRAAKHDPEIHGFDGLGGVEGLPSADDHPVIRNQLEKSESAGLRAVEGISKAVKDAMKEGEKITVVSTGPMTNIALFVSVYPDLLDSIEEFVFMGGGVGQGNRSSVAEYNILCDPEAAQIVLNVPVKKTMVPINVTHTAIVTKSIHASLLDPQQARTSSSPILPLPQSKTPLRRTLSTLISFFASSYESTFGFKDGPPLHDALTIAYVGHPELFKCTQHRVDIELTGTHTSGETVVDLFNYRRCDETWGREGKNCLVAENLYVDGFFKLFLDCVDRCDAVSPLNKSRDTK